jgi:type IV secretion system protein VirB9
MLPIKEAAMILALTVASTVSQAADNPAKPALQPSAPRAITVTEADTPPVVRTGLLQATLVILPPEEKVATVFGGDTVSWVFDAGHVASRYISIKPKIAGSTTDVHIVSDHGNEYTLELKEISSDSDPHFDSKVFVSPGEQAGKDKLVSTPVFVPAADLEKVKAEAAETNAREQNEIKTANTKAEEFKAQYPGQLHFDYEWDHTKARKLGLNEIWRDDKFTYLRGHFEETPALYELKDGQGSLINYDFANGLYTIPKTLSAGYLTIGKARVDFKRTERN